jgi:hypothetical protein
MQCVLPLVDVENCARWAQIAVLSTARSLIC